MNKLSLILSRMVLTVGLLVALTPCALCAAPSMGAPMAAMGHCPMGHSQKGDCCHRHSTGPLCKIMGQSSLQVSQVHLDASAMPAASGILVYPPVFTAALVSLFVPAVFSPPRAPLSLRI